MIYNAGANLGYRPQGMSIPRNVWKQMIGKVQRGTLDFDPLACRVLLYWRGHSLAMHWRYKNWLNPRIHHSSFVLGPLAAALQTFPDQVIVVLSAFDLQLLQLFVSSAIVLQGSLSVSKLWLNSVKFRHCLAWLDLFIVILLSAPASVKVSSSRRGLYSLLAVW